MLALSLFPPLLATLATAKEGEQKTILQVYVSSISAHEYLLGKILTFMVVSACECLLLLTLLFTYFGLNFAGDPTPFIVATILYAFCVASFGTMVGAAIPNQAAAMQAVALGGFLLVFMLSGLIFPIQNIPAQIRWLSNFIWGRYYIDIVRDALLQGGGWPAVWWKVIIIAVIGLIFYTLGLAQHAPHATESVTNASYSSNFLFSHRFRALAAKRIRADPPRPPSRDVADPSANPATAAVQPGSERHGLRSQTRHHRRQPHARKPRPDLHPDRKQKLQARRLLLRRRTSSATPSAAASWMPEW